MYKSIKYSLNKRFKWQLKQANHILVAADKTVMNSKTNRVIKETTCGGSYGYWIGKKFILTTKMNQHNLNYHFDYESEKKGQ